MPSLESWLGIRPCQMNHRPSFKIQSQSQLGNPSLMCTAEVHPGHRDCMQTYFQAARTQASQNWNRSQRARRSQIPTDDPAPLFTASHEQLCIDHEDNSVLEFGRFSPYPSPRVGAQRYTRARPSPNNRSFLPLRRPSGGEACAAGSWIATPKRS